MPQTLLEPRQALSPELPTPSWQEAPLRVRDVMAVSPITITPDVSVPAARTLMQQRQIRHLPVLADGRLVGMVTDRDVRLVLPSPATSLAVQELNYLLARLTVGEVMTLFVVTTAPHVPVTEAAGRMLRHKIGALPVVEGRRLVGILTRSDILRAFRRLHPELPAVK
jgi:acetoin utilization protein AcuB